MSDTKRLIEAAKNVLMNHEGIFTPELIELREALNAAPLTYGGIPCDPKPANNEPGTWIVFDEAAKDMSEQDRTILQKWYKGWLLEYGVVPRIIKSREECMEMFPATNKNPGG